MKFNLFYAGGDAFFYNQRDFSLALKYSLESLGHEVDFTTKTIERNKINILLGSHVLSENHINQIFSITPNVIVIVGEILKNYSINFDLRFNFTGVILPLLTRCKKIWDTLNSNYFEYSLFGLDFVPLKVGYCPELEEIHHRHDKDLDYYFFGNSSPKRERTLRLIADSGLLGFAQLGGCSSELRNNHIARAKVQLNLNAYDNFKHANAGRITYLVNNRCCVVSDSLPKDTSGIMDYVVSTKNSDHMIETIKELIYTKNYLHIQDENYTEYKKTSMKDNMLEILERTF